MNLDALTPAAAKETNELLRALLSNAVATREALERIDNRMDSINSRLDTISYDVSEISIDTSAISTPRP